MTYKRTYTPPVACRLLTLTLLAVLSPAALAQTASPHLDLDADESSLADEIEHYDSPATGCGADQCGGGCDHGLAGYRPLIPRCSHFQFRGEYLLWWTDGANTPPLVTTSPPAQAGVLGPNTSILFGGAPVTDDSRSGGRLTMTWWRGPCETSGLMFSHLRLGQESTPYRGVSDGTAVLARPFFNVTTGAQDARLIGFPAAFSGSVAIDATTEMQGWEGMLRRSLLRRPGFRTDLLFGYRYNRLADALIINDSSTTVAGTTVAVFDRFDTENLFHGATVGVLLEKRARGWSWELLMKLGVGNTRAEVLIDGSTTTTVPAVLPVVTAGGLLAQPTNMGTYSRNDFTMIPELGLTVGYDLAPNLRATLGYTLLYWSKVARPGDQIDFDVNDSQFSGGALVGAPRPEFSWVTTDFFAQGVNVGLEYEF